MGRSDAKGEPPTSWFRATIAQVRDDGSADISRDRHYGSAPPFSVEPDQLIWCQEFAFKHAVQEHACWTERLTSLVSGARADHRAPMRNTLLKAAGRRRVQGAALIGGLPLKSKY
jgi:hypothetical protein